MFHADAATALAALDYPGLIDALEAEHATAGLPFLHTEVHADPKPARGNVFIGLTAWEGEGDIAVKLVGVYPGNAARPEPLATVQGLVALFDGETGRPVATCDGDALTVRKTMAVSALGARFLARRDAQRLLVLGAGGLAPHAIAAHLAARPSIEHVEVWNRTPGRAHSLVAALPELAAEVSVVTDLDAALARACVISAVTMAETPLIRGALLRPGTHVDLVGGYTPAMREADDDTIRRAGRLFISTWKGFDDSGDVAQPLASGLLRREDIPADLYDLAAARHPGRRDAEEITVFKNIGGAHLDLYAMRYLRRRRAAGRV